MQQIFSRPLLISFTAIALLTLGACDYLVSDQSRIQKATQLRTRGDYRAAAIELKKVLQSHPDNRDARFLLGEISLLTGEAAAAEKELRRAQELGIPKGNVVLPLGRALLAQGDYDRALKELDLSRIEHDDARAGVLTLHGDAYLGLGRLDQAQGAFREVLSLRADSLEARIGLALVERSKGNLGAAEAYIAEALSKDPAYIRAWLARGQVELDRAEYTQAEEAFTHVLKLSPLPAVEEFTALDGLAESQWRQGRADAALPIVERLLKLTSQHPRPRYFRALIAYGAGDYKTAKDYLQGVLRDFPDYESAKILLGATHFAEGNLEQADMYLSSVLAADPSSLPTRKLLAATRLRQQKPQDAMAVLTPAMAQNSNDGQVLALMGQASLQAGHADTGILYLERGARTDPANQALQMELAAGYATAGNLGHAIGLLEKMPETKQGDYGRELLLILTQMRKGDSDSALAQARKLLASRPNDPDVYSLAGSVYMAAGQLPRAREHFERALQLAPDNLAILMNLGRLAVREGKQDDAQARFERVLAVSPGNLNAALALAQLSGLRHDPAGAKQWLERASAANPKALEPKLLLVRQCLETGDFDQARTLATDLARAEPENAEVHNVLGVVQMVDRKYEEAVASFRKAVAAAPNSPNFSYNLARAQVARQDFGEAKKLLAKTLELQPHHLRAVSTLAAIEMREGNATQALARARDLQQDKDKETAAAGHALEGDLLMTSGKFDNAARAYDAASRQDRSAQLAIKSYRARRRAEVPDAAKPLEEWLSGNPGDARARLALAQGYQERGQFKQAAAEYELVLKARPTDAVALNNLAWIYHDAKDPRAIQMAEKAHELQPENGAITDTLGWLLVQEGQAQRALELLRKAVKQAPQIPDIRYHLAAALAKTGANEEARRTLTDLVNSGQTFQDLADAKQLLKQLPL